MIDALNAEIALGTIANVSDGIQWIGYTYLFGVYLVFARVSSLLTESVRMKREPFVYGEYLGLAHLTRDLTL
jgi:antiviral helicase SLH1